MFDDLIKKNKKWKTIYVGCNPIKISEKGFKIWGQKTLKLRDKSDKSEQWYAPAGFIRKQEKFSTKVERPFFSEKY